MESIRIKGIEVVHGNNIIDNEFYIEHYKKQDKNVEHFFKDIMGRDKRYVINPQTENSLTMAISVAKKVIKETNLSGKDIDMIVLSSYLPEYVSPPSSVIIHQSIGGKSECMCYDVNINCSGMTFSIEQIYRQMVGNRKINRALLIGSDYLDALADKSNAVCYGQFGDAACGIIFEKSDEKCGFIDSEYNITPNKVDYVRAPAKGTSHISECSIGSWQPFDTKEMFEDGVKNIRTVLKRNNLTVDDISMFCLSQFQIKYFKYVRDELDIPSEKCMYIGDEYGYTGTTSPLIVLNESIKNGKIKRNDNIIIWTVGMGGQNIAILLKY